MTRRSEAQSHLEVMRYQDKTNEQLVAENDELRRRVTALEGAEGERQRADEALRESERRYRALVESTKDVIYILDREGRLLYANPAASQRIGISSSELIGKRQSDLFPNETARSHIERIERVFTTGETLESDRSYQFGAEEIWLRVHLIPLRNDAGQITAAMGVCHDITDRKRAEAALWNVRDELERRVSERTAELTKLNAELSIFRSFAEASSQGFSMADLDGHLLYLNPALCRMLDDVRPEDYIGRHLSICYPEESNRRGKEEIEPALQRQGRWEGEITMLTRDGRIIPTWHSGFVIRDESGNPVRLAVAINDITRRKAAQKALRASEERFRVIFEEAPAGIVTGIANGVLTHANRAFCQMTGYTEEELIGVSIHDLTHPDDRAQTHELHRQLETDEIPRFTVEKRYLKKDGGFFWAQVTGALVREPGGQDAAGMAIVEDITQRKQADAALRQSRDELQAIYDGTSDGLLIVDVETKSYAKANASICRMLGYSEAEMLSRTIPDIHPAEEVPVVLRNIEHRAAGLLQGHVDTRLRRKDGAILYADVVGFPLMHGGRRCVMAFFSDITAQKEVQEALERERRTLKHMLQASDHERRLIAYDIHDGLAQELSGAIMQLQVFAHARQTGAPGAEEHFDVGLSMLRGSQAEARRLISGVRPPILDESGVVAAIAHLAYDTAIGDGPKIELRNRITFKRLAPIVENVIYRIVQEALTNARNHSRTKAIRISLAQRGDKLRVLVRDWGVGFDPKTVPDSRFGIEGIRERTRLLGGECRIKSRPGKGTAVIVELPVVELPPEAVLH